MARASRTDNWGFPRWRPYEANREAAKVRLCDRHGCGAAGVHPAPKSPNRPERWWFCAEHAAEYNASWDYFRGLSAEEAAARERGAAGESAFASSAHWGWGGPGDGSRSRAELDALAALELDADADFVAVKAAHRRMVKANHPDAAPGDAAAAERFRAAQAAFEVLERAEEGRPR